MAKYKKSRIYERIQEKLKEEYDSGGQKESEILLFILNMERKNFSGLSCEEQNKRIDQFKKMEMSIYYYIQCAVCADTRDYEKVMREIKEYESFNPLPSRRLFLRGSDRGMKGEWL